MFRIIHFLPDELSNEREKHKLSNKMKMNVYLMSQLVELIETDVQQKESANVAIANKKGQKKKVSLESWSWDEKRLEAVTLFFRLMSLNVNALFEPPIIEEELVNLVGNCVFRIFENPGIALQRLKDTRSGKLFVYIFQLFVDTFQLFVCIFSCFVYIFSCLFTLFSCFVYTFQLFYLHFSGPV